MAATLDIPCFVINMAKELTRWHALQAQCPPELKFTRFEAVDGRCAAEHSVSQIQDLGQLTAPELGCLLSHIGVWQHVLQHNLPLAVVLEDDVMFGNNFVARLQGFLQRLPQNFDLAYLGFNANAHVKFAIPGVGKVVVIVDGEHYDLNTEETACYRLYRAWGTCAYVISQQGAACLLDLVMNKTYPGYHHFDFTNGLGGLLNCAFPTSPIDMRIMSLMEQLQAYVAFPPICQPHPQLDSTITQRAWDA